MAPSALSRGGRCCTSGSNLAGGFAVSCPEETWQRVWGALLRFAAQLRRRAKNHPRFRCLHEAGGPGGPRHPHPAPGPLGNAGDLYHLPAQKHPGHPAGGGTAGCSGSARPSPPPGKRCTPFPTAAQLAGAQAGDLAACKLGYRVPYLQDAVARVLSGQLDLARPWPTLPDAELFETLKTIRGVGDKVANCICLFSYGRMSAAPRGYLDP